MVVSPASFAASIRPSVTVLRQSTHVPKTSKKSALSGIVGVVSRYECDVFDAEFASELESFDGWLF
jgi:hypothetical protein